MENSIMKKSIFFVLLSAVLAYTLMGCAKETPITSVEQKEIQEEVQEGHHMTLSLSLPTDTKMTHDLEGTTIKPKWELGDRIRVSGGGNTNNGTWVIASASDITDGGKSAVFTSDDTTIDENTTVTIFYNSPFKGGSMAENYDFSDQDGSYTNLPEILVARDKKISSGAISLTSALTYIHFHLDQDNNPDLTSEDGTFKSVIVSKAAGEIVLCKAYNVRNQSYTEGEIVVTPTTPFSVSKDGEWSIDFYVAVRLEQVEDYSGSSLKLYFSNADYSKTNDNVVHNYAEIQHMEGTVPVTKKLSTGRVYKSSVGLTYTANTVGAIDNTSEYNTVRSSAYTIPEEKTLELQFTNYGPGTDAWHNWVICVNDGAGNDYFYLTCANNSWGDSNHSASRRYIGSTGDIPVQEGDWWWDYFRSNMNGAKVILTLERTKHGSLLVSSYSYIPNSNVVYYEKYSHPIPAGNVAKVQLLTDLSHYQIQGISTYDSTTQLTYLQSDYYVASDDISLTTVKGTVTDANLVGHYSSWFDDTSKLADVPMDGTLLTTTTGTIDASGEAGIQTFTNGATYNSSAIDYKANVIKGTSSNGSPTLVWGDSYDALAKLSSSESVTKHFYVYSACEQNWSCPSVILSDSESYDASNRAFVRLDNCVDGNGTFAGNNDDDYKASDWNWSLFKAYLNRAKVTVKVSNAGSKIATVQYGVIWANGESHYQNFKKIVTPSESFYYTISITNGYIVFVDDETASAKGWPAITPLE